MLSVTRLAAHLWQFTVDSQHVWLIGTVWRYLCTMYPDIVYTAAGDSYLFRQRVSCVTYSISAAIAYIQIQVAIGALIP